MAGRRRKAPAEDVIEFDIDDLYSPTPPAPPPEHIAQTQTLTSDDRRLRTSNLHLPPSPQKKKRRLSGAGLSDSVNFGDPHEEPENVILCEPEKRPWKRRHYVTADEPLRDFEEHVDEYVEELMRIEGRGDAADSACPTCRPDDRRPPLFRCTGCTGYSMYCQRCIVRSHAKRPFCCVEQWDGESFARVSLASLGLTIQLGHHDGQACTNPTLAHKEFIIMDIGGIYQCAVYQCGCSGAPTLRQQLLRHRLFPASANSPKTACTFNLLEHFHHLTHHGKVTMYDFYNALEKMTDDIGVMDLKDRHEVFTRCIREWKYLMMLRFGGRGNDCKRAASNVRPGELAIRCPACPIPGENLPQGWQNAPKEQKYLYFLIIALDACFRLKRRQVSSEAKDPRLVDGGAYLVRHKPFAEWIKTAGTQDETTSSCSGLSALEHANTKYSKGYSETGKGIGVCARHEFVQANGVVPLQAGERYANMDYALGSLLQFHSSALQVTLSYDIACQFSKNLLERIKKLPPHVRFNAIALTMRFVIPKLHILGHQMACQLLFNFAYLFGAARTDGEGVERPWAHLGPVATSLRQMGPGSAADTLDDHLNYWNWLKLVALGAFLLRKLLEALKEEAIQRAHLEEFSREQAAHVPQWREQVLAFEDGQDVPNPFELPKSSGTEAEIQLDLAREEASAISSGADTAHEQSPADFVIALLDAEEQQRILARNVTEKTYTTTKQQKELFRQRSKVGRLLNKLKPARDVYMPPASARLRAWEGDAANANATAEGLPLLPPSALTKSEREACVGDVVAVERRLRDAQCRDSLNGIRDLLLAKTRELRFKNTNVRHQGLSTRARTLIDGYDTKIRALASKYIFARAALVALREDESVDIAWRALDMNRDLRGMDEQEGGQAASMSAGAATTFQRLREGTGEGRRTVSWIWYGTNTNDPNAQGTELYEGVRVEWCKGYARLRRWQEQIPLIREEMRRTRASLQFRANEWMERQSAEIREGAVGEGARAYTARQHRVYKQLDAHFASLWAAAPAAKHINVADAQAIEADLEERDQEDPAAAGRDEEEESDDEDD